MTTNNTPNTKVYKVQEQYIMIEVLTNFKTLKTPNTQNS